MTLSFPKALIAILVKSEIFDADWYNETYPDVAMSGIAPHTHYKRFGVYLGRAPSLDLKHKLDAQTPDVMYKLVRAAIAQARTPSQPTEFDDGFYLQTYPHIDHRKLTPYAHFRAHGHKDLRNPSPDFDIVWYLQNYGHTYDVGSINAFDHYLQTGHAMGHTPRPRRDVLFDKTMSHTLPEGSRRACLFAAYDADAKIDDYVIIYLREMAKHADVFYMADCDMPPSEMAKLDGIVTAAWAWRHGAYDFGSYSILARDLVGWGKLAEYDEVVFANDSCYLVQPLAETFERMAAKPCAWWGMQATKGIAISRPTQPFPNAEGVLDIDDVKNNYLSRFEYDPIYDFHIGSYFMAFRRHVIQDKRFQNAINAIDVEPKKLNIVLKYEVGLTHLLIGLGYEFATWGQTLTKEHPVYTDVAFDLLKTGFPLFKRFFLAENPYKVSSLAYWKSALKQAGSVTSVAHIEENYLRVSNADKVYRNHNILTDNVLGQPPMSSGLFLNYDQNTPKYDNYWGFPVCLYDHTLSDNNRALFEEVKNNPKITKVIFTRDRNVKIDGVNVICVPLKSHEGQLLMVRCRNLFVRHGAAANLHWPVDARLHNIINLWHGIPIKRIGTASLDLKEQRAMREAENARLTAVISASDVDRLAMAAAYVPKIYDDIWLTGLPRHDLITKPQIQLSNELLAQITDAEALMNGRKMVLFCPTFRKDQKDGYYNFTPDQVKKLTVWLAKHNMVMGIREHPADTSHQYSSQLIGETFIRVDARRFPDVEMLYRKATMMITDYSSCFIDYMLTGRPVISFAYDLEDYKERERGLFYELEEVFPGPVAQTFSSLMKALDVSVSFVGNPTSEAYKIKRKFFIKYIDSKNAQRVVEHTNAANSGSQIAKDLMVADTYKTPKSIVFLYQRANGITNRYRIFALLPKLRRMGWTVHAMDINHAAPGILAKAEFVSLCRIKMSTLAIDLIETARHYGAKIVYDTDDLLHDSEAFQTSEYFLRDVKRANSMQKLSEQTLQIMRLVDAYTVTTQTLLRSVIPLNAPAKIIPNCLSQRLLDIYSLPLKRENKRETHISYLSGTATHMADFAECRKALVTLLSERPDVTLHIVGKLDLDDMLDQGLGDQIRQHGLMPYDAMHEFLRTVDLNLAPLVDSSFNDAKSELKIFEAALHEVPTIASSSATYKALINDGKNGYLARSPNDWHMALFAAVDNPETRRAIGKAARVDIVPLYTADLSAECLSEFLETLRASK
tara:strand:+ start:916 stop:4632 length:3717 start_codon:yes stop_codon:yes gene_type:complete